MDGWFDSQSQEIWLTLVPAAAALIVLLFSIFRTHFWS